MPLAVFQKVVTTQVPYEDWGYDTPNMIWFGDTISCVSLIPIGTYVNMSRPQGVIWKLETVNVPIAIHDDGDD